MTLYSLKEIGKKLINLANRIDSMLDISDLHLTHYDVKFIKGLGTYFNNKSINFEIFINESIQECTEPNTEFKYLIPR